MPKTPRRQKSKPPKYVCIGGPMDNVLVNMGKDRFVTAPLEAFRVPGPQEGCYVFVGTDQDGYFEWTLVARADHWGRRTK